MVIESVSLSWEGVSIHCPEHPFYLSDRIERLSPGWKVRNMSDDGIVIHNEGFNASLASDYNGSKALFLGEYGKNLKPMWNLGDTMKRIGEFYSIPVRPRIASKECEFKMVLSEKPMKIDGFTEIEYDPIAFPYAAASNPDKRKSKPLVTKKDGMPAIEWTSVYNNVMKNYQHVFPKIFVY
jgi:hypothetical protein